MLGRRLPALCVALLGTAGAVLALRIAPYQIDDASIFYRYAVHLADGHGPVFNIGGPRVEGFTSPAWLFLLTLVAALAGPVALAPAAAALGLLATVATSVVLARAASSAPADGESGHGPWHRVIALGIFLLAPGTAFYAITGMDEPLFVLVVAVLAGALAHGSSGRWVAAVAVAAPWVRPEAAWLLVAGVLQIVATGGWPARRGAALRMVVGLVAGGAALAATRWWLFGTLVPNTFHAKPGSWVEGVAYVLSALQTPWGTALALSSALGAIAGGRACRGFLAAGVAWLGAAVLAGGDWMPGGRMLLPAVACLGLAACGMAALRGPRLGAVAIAVPLAAAATGAWDAWRAGTIARETDAGLCEEARTLGRWAAGSGARSMALVDVGIAGFESGLAIVDLAGLTDPIVARAPGGHLGKAFDLGYLFAERRPDLIVLRTNRQPPPTPRQWRPLEADEAEAQVERRVLQDRRLAAHYRFVFAIYGAVPRIPFYGKVVYARRDLPLRPGSVPPAPVVTVRPPES